MLEDESPAVQHLAGGIFQRIGAGATDAAPLLLALRAKGAPPGLVARATVCLGLIGPSALAAIPPLKAALRQTPGDSDVLTAPLADCGHLGRRTGSIRRPWMGSGATSWRP
jgi:hypothetical protein